MLTCVHVCALVSSRLILPWTGDHRLSCTLLCEHEKVMVFLSQPIWVNVVSPSQVPSDAFYFPKCLLWTDWSWQALTFRNVPINGIHGCWYALCWDMKSSAAAVHRWHLNPSSLLIMMSFHCTVKSSWPSWIHLYLLEMLPVYLVFFFPQMCLSALGCLGITPETRLMLIPLRSNWNWS